MVVLLPSLIESETCSSIIQETIKAKGQAIPFISTSSKKKETFVASWPRTNNMVEKSYSDAGNRTQLTESCSGFDRRGRTSLGRSVYDQGMDSMDAASG